MRMTLHFSGLNLSSHLSNHFANFKIATYNLHSFRQGVPFLQALGNVRDIIFVQEHWLAPFDLLCML